MLAARAAWRGIGRADARARTDVEGAAGRPIAHGQLVMVEPRVAVVFGSPDTLVPQAAGRAAGARSGGMGQPRGRGGAARAGPGAGRADRLHGAAWTSTARSASAVSTRRRTSVTSTSSRSRASVAHRRRGRFSISRTSACRRIRLAAAIDSAIRSGHSALPVLERRLAELPRAGTLRRRAARPADAGHRWRDPARASASCGVLRREPSPADDAAPGASARTASSDASTSATSDLGVVVEVTGRKGHASDAERQTRRPTPQRADRPGAQGVRVHPRRRRRPARNGSR